MCVCVATFHFDKALVSPTKIVKVKINSFVSQRKAASYRGVGTKGRELGKHLMAEFRKLQLIPRTRWRENLEALTKELSGTT